jgi:hypothetical protein
VDKACPCEIGLRDTAGRFAMKLSFTNAVLVALGLSLLGIVNIAAANTGAARKTECVAADGSGRKVPCAAANRRQADQRTYECFTDDGYGRRLQCGIGPK